jgi:hypothetical protein
MTQVRVTPCVSAYGYAWVQVRVWISIPEAKLYPYPWSYGYHSNWSDGPMSCQMTLSLLPPISQISTVISHFCCRNIPSFPFLWVACHIYYPPCMPFLFYLICFPFHVTFRDQPPPHTPQHVWTVEWCVCVHLPHHVSHLPTSYHLPTLPLSYLVYHITLEHFHHVLYTLYTLNTPHIVSCMLYHIVPHCSTAHRFVLHHIEFHTHLVLIAFARTNLHPSSSLCYIVWGLFVSFVWVFKPSIIIVLVNSSPFFPLQSSLWNSAGFYPFLYLGCCC